MSGLPAVISASLAILMMALPVAIQGQAEPEGATLIFSDGFESGNYFEWSEAATGNADSSRPFLSFLAPTEPILVDETMPTIELLFFDYESGIALDSLRAELDGVELLPACTINPSGATCTTSNLTQGVHRVSASIFDQAGNSTRATLSFEIVFDTEPPTIEILSPTPGQILANRYVEVQGTVADDGLVDEVVINGQRVVVVDGGFQLALQLAEGINTIEAVATDTVGRTSSASVEVTADTLPPFVIITAPAAGITTNLPLATLEGEVSDATNIVGLRIDGFGIPVVDGGFSTQVSLEEGLNEVPLEAEDVAGNVSFLTHSLTLITVPSIGIDGPLNGFQTTQGRVTVSGTVVGAVTEVTVAGLPAQVSDGNFVAEDIPLFEGVNALTVIAVASSGVPGVATVTVVRDSQGPRILVDFPEDGADLADSEIAVRGQILDSTSGGSSTVEVNGFPAEISGESFFSPAIALDEGENLITIVATDPLGNMSQEALTIWRSNPASEYRLSMVSGNRQVGAVGTLLSEPLEVLASDGEGMPVKGVPVVFSVAGNNGRLGNGNRRQILTTDANGKTAATFTLGTFAGLGSQVVKAESAGFGAGVRFFANSTPGAPERIVVDSGFNQIGAIGERLAAPLAVVVTDAWANRLTGTPVMFTVSAGGGSLEGLGSSGEVTTDANGQASVDLRLGPENGRSRNIVEARISALPDGPVAAFVSSGFSVGLAEETSVSGVVLDNTGHPVPDVEVQIVGSSRVATTDADGTFRLANAPVGTLELHVDGTTTSRPGSWPELEFILFSVAGRENSLDRPIYLLPLETENVLAVDEFTGGVLALPEVPGFALEVAPGSVTFPGGGRVGNLSVTPVHVDKIPMEPNFGQQPRFIVTIQPAGVIFDPPARLSLPNGEGFEPGEVTQLYSFDHDAGRFVSIGLATTSDDGTVLRSNPGGGVVKAGWHCGGNPSTTGAPFSCPDCESCSGSDCVADSSQDGLPCDRTGRCETNRRCLGGECVADRVLADRIDGPCIVEHNGTATFSVVSNDPAQISWLATGGSAVVQGQGPTFSLTPAAFPDAPPSSRNISAYCALPPATKRLWVGPSCGLFADPEILEFQITGGPFDTSGLWGGFRAETNFPSLTACVDTDQWCPALKSYKFEYTLELAYDPSAPNARIPLSGPDDAVNITPETCEEVLVSVFPTKQQDMVSSQGKEYPGFLFYLYVPALEAHEAFHLDDYRERVVEKTISDFQELARSRCQPCGAPTPNLFTEFNRIRTENTLAWRVDNERLAHDFSNSIFNDLIEGIRSYVETRPDVAQFPALCRLDPPKVESTSKTRESP